MPHFEPSTGLESFCTLDRYIQQHVKAATGDPSPEILVLQSTVDRLRENRNQAVRDRHTLHGQYTELVRTHNDNVARMRTLDTTVADAKKEFEANMEIIAGLRHGFKVEQDRANQARTERDRDAIKLAKVTAELNDIKTVTNHPGVLYTKLQAEVDVKSESIKKLEKRVAEAEGAAKVERDSRHLAETRAAQKARESEGLYQAINRLSLRVSELEKECAQHKTLKYDLAVAKSALKNANTEVTRLREAQSGIMARSDDMRTKNDGLTERVAELEAEALLPMPSSLLVHPVAPTNTISVDQSTPLVDSPLQITRLKRALKQAQVDNAELEAKVTNLETEAARSKIQWMVRRIQIKDSQKAQAQAESQIKDSQKTQAQAESQIKDSQEAQAQAESQIKDSQEAQAQAERELGDSRNRNQQLLDQISELKEMISKYEAQIELPLPSQIGIPTIEQQHSVVVCDLRLEVAIYQGELEEVRAQLRQALSDLEEARFP